MPVAQLDGVDVFESFAVFDAKRGQELTPENLLPYPKGAVRQVLKHMIGLSSEPELGYLKSLYIRLAGYTQMTVSESVIVARVEAVLAKHFDAVSAEQLGVVIEELDPDGIYARISATSSRETIEFMNEVGFGENSRA
jgi:phenylpyruvate tautomerase PptA (4-oxalocrotonate tautomerase family)